MSQYRSHAAAPAIKAEIKTTSAWVEQADLGGLPLICIQDQLLVGEQTAGAFSAALHRIEREHPADDPQPVRHD